MDSGVKKQTSFETHKDVLDWYERQDRVLTPEFISNIPWGEVKAHELDERFVPVLLYMRDVETLTDMYHRELLRTPTGKDPHIGKFMERWGVEEITHGEVINRFLNEAGFETDDDWQEQVRRDVSKVYKTKMYLITAITNLVGKKFTATHMTFGAIHEMEAAQGYRRLIDLANHPVLTHILKGIIREEAAHGQFYRNIARIELARDEFSQKMARWVIDHFWEPVGQGSLPAKRTAYTIRTLFEEDSALDTLDNTVTKRAQQLPGFEGITKMTDVIGKIATSPVAACTVAAAAAAISFS